MLYPAVLFPIGLTLLCAFVWRATAISRLAVAGSAQWHPVREALDVGLDDDIDARVSTIFS